MNFKDLSKTCDEVTDSVRIKDDFLSWLRGGKPSKEVVTRFADWVKKNISLRGGSLTRNAKTYLAVKVELPSDINTNNIELKLVKITKDKDGRNMIAYYAPTTRYKKAETQDVDTL